MSARIGSRPDASLPDRLIERAAPVRDALAAGAPVVALETTVVAHGLPWPRNLEVARAMHDAVSGAGAVPACIALAAGRIHIGLADDALERLARSADSASAGAGTVAKASRRDIAALLAAGRSGATTVAGTLVCAARAGIGVFATGGIGGVHLPHGRRGADGRGGAGGPGRQWDISADLVELARAPVAVVCSGAKSILDLPATVEMLETLGVPVVGYKTRSFPAFFTRDSGLPVSATVDDAAAAARVADAQAALGLGGMVLANPVPRESALDRAEHELWLERANEDAAAAGVRGAALSPYLLARMENLSGGRTLDANAALLLDNARVAGEVAVELATLRAAR